MKLINSYDFFQDPNQWIRNSHLENDEVLKVIFVHSKSLRVVETKLEVYRKFKSLFEFKMVHLQHVYEDFDDIAKKSANAKIFPFPRVIFKLSSIIERIPYEILDKIVSKAAKENLSKEKITHICFNEFITDGGNVGTVDNNSYTCRNFVTLERIKWKLVIQTLHTIGELLEVEICKKMVFHIEHQMKIVFKGDRKKLNLDIFGTFLTDIYYELLSSSYVSIFDPFFDFGSVIATFVTSVDVNSQSWRGKVADEIYLVLSKNQKYILDELFCFVERMCRCSAEDLKNVARSISKWTQKMQCKGIHECKSKYKE